MLEFVFIVYFTIQAVLLIVGARKLNRWWNSKTQPVRYINARAVAKKTPQELQGEYKRIHQQARVFMQRGPGSGKILKDAIKQNPELLPILDAQGISKMQLPFGTNWIKPILPKVLPRLYVFLKSLNEV